MRTATLGIDITAHDLAMDAPDGEEGYPRDWIIGRAGTTVKIIEEDGGDGYLEVQGFSEDPYASGYIAADSLVDEDEDPLDNTEEGV